MKDIQGGQDFFYFNIKAQLLMFFFYCFRGYDKNMSRFFQTYQSQIVFTVMFRCFKTSSLTRALIFGNGIIWTFYLFFPEFQKPSLLALKSEKCLIQIDIQEDIINVFLNLLHLLISSTRLFEFGSSQGGLRRINTTRFKPAPRNSKRTLSYQDLTNADRNKLKKSLFTGFSTRDLREELIRNDKRLLHCE